MHTHDFSILLLIEILLEQSFEPFVFELKISLKGHITYLEVIMYPWVFCGLQVESYSCLYFK